MADLPVAEIPLSAITDETAFLREVVAPCRPAILRRACADWLVYREGKRSAKYLQAYLTAFDNGNPAQAFIGGDAIAGRYHYGDRTDGFNFVRETMKIGQALERITQCAEDPAQGTVYMGSLPADSHLPGFAEANSLPFLPRGIRPRLWIGNVSSIPCHYDTFDNMACVVTGRRSFTLYPPEAISDLYVGPIDHTMAGQPISLAAGAPPGDPRYPRFQALHDRAIVAELEPGDALYLPKLWWHAVEARDNWNLLVNYWWDAFSAGPDAPFTTMMLAMIAIAERPAPERAAWRAFFDHYVFRPDGHPLAHLPEDRHGILGPLDKGNYGRIRAMVMQLLRGN
ncbi:MAG: cupin-like domain-containing protein [Sphingobium sp.]